MSTKRIAKNFFFLSSGQVISALVSFFVNIYLARVLTAQGYGLISFATAIFVYLTFIVDAGLASFGMREVAKYKEKAAEYGLTAHLVAVLLSVQQAFGLFGGQLTGLHGLALVLRLILFIAFLFLGRRRLLRLLLLFLLLSFLLFRLFLLFLFLFLPVLGIFWLRLLILLLLLRLILLILLLLLLLEQLFQLLQLLVVGIGFEAILDGLQRGGNVVGQKKNLRAAVEKIIRRSELRPGFVRGEEQQAKADDEDSRCHRFALISW